MTRAVAFGITLLAIARLACADADQDWQKILAQETGPNREIKTSADVIEHLAAQEKALRDFAEKHASDPRVIDALGSQAPTCSCLLL